MTIDDELDDVRDAVKAAQDEIIMAIMFHETWKPSAYDESLHERMGSSFATHAFQIVRLSLRREMLMALMRLWDTDKRAIRMTAIAEKLRNKDFFDALVTSRIPNSSLPSSLIAESIREALVAKRDEVIRLVRKYSEGGAGFTALEKMRALRHEHLAHRQVDLASTAKADATAKEIEFFYDDNLELVRLLLSLVLGTAFDLTDAASVYEHHASYFWAGVRGERTEGHPNYHPPV